MLSRQSGFILSLCLHPGSSVCVPTHFQKLSVLYMSFCALWPPFPLPQPAYSIHTFLCVGGVHSLVILFFFFLFTGSAYVQMCLSFHLDSFRNLPTGPPIVQPILFYPSGHIIFSIKSKHLSRSCNVHIASAYFSVTLLPDLPPSLAPPSILHP